MAFAEGIIMNKSSKLQVAIGVVPKIRTNGRRRPATGLSCLRVVIFSVVALVATRASALGPNVLVNGDFEGTIAHPAPTTGANNIGWSILPWVIGSGQQANVVTVKADGSYHYLAGPQRDASTATGPVLRHYLDIANGHNDIYQPFTLQCEGAVQFGGWFSSRCDNDGTAHAGSGSIQLVQGTGTGVTPPATTYAVTLHAGGNAHTDPWKLASASVSLAAGEYTLVL